MIGPQLIWDTNKKLYSIYQMVPFPMIWNDVENLDSKVMPLFDAEYLRNCTR